MPLDAQIPLSVQTPKPPDPLEQYGRVMQLQSAMQGQQLQQAQLTGVNLQNQQEQQNLTDDQNFRKLYSDSITKGTQLSDADLMQTLGPTKGAAFMKSRLEATQTRATIQELSDKHAAAEADYGGSLAAGLQAQIDPATKLVKPEAIGAAIAQANRDGYQNEAQQLAQLAQSNPQAIPAVLEQMIKKSPKQQELINSATQAQGGKERGDAAAQEAALKAQQDFKQRAARLLSVTDPVQYAQNFGVLSQDPVVKTTPALLAQYDAPTAFNPQSSPTKAAQNAKTQEQIDQASQAATNQAETARHNQAEEAHNRVEEGQGAQRVVIEGQKLRTEQYNAGLGPDGKPLAGSNLTGDDFLKTLPFGLQQRVKAITDGREPIPTGRAASSGAGRQLAEAVTQYDPGYSVQRGQMRSAFTTGSQGQNIGALSTAAVHIDQYTQALQAMQNGTFRPGTEAYNNFRATFGNSAPTTAQGIANAVAGETATALKGNATDPEIASVKSAMPQNGSPQQIADYAKAQLHVLGAKLNTYDERFQAVSPGDKWTPVLPSAQQVFDKYGVKPLTRFGGGPNASGGAAQPGNNSGGHIIALNGKQYQYKGSGATDDLGNYTEIKK